MEERPEDTSCKELGILRNHSAASGWKHQSCLGMLTAILLPAEDIVIKGSNSTVPPLLFYPIYTSVGTLRAVQDEGSAT